MTIKLRILATFLALQIIGYALLVSFNSQFIESEQHAAINREVKQTLTNAVTRIDESHRLIRDKALDIALLGDTYRELAIIKRDMGAASIEHDIGQLLSRSVAGKDEIQRVTTIYKTALERDKGAITYGMEYERLNDTATPITAQEYLYSPWYKAVVADNSDSYWSASYADKNGDIVISHARSMNDASGDSIGAIKIDWDLRVIANFLDKLEVSKNAFTFLVDSKSLQVLTYIDGEVVAGQKLYENDFLKGRVDPTNSNRFTVIEGVEINESLYNIFYTNSNSGLLFGAVIPNSDILLVVNRILEKNLTVALMAAIGLMLATTLLTILSFKPLNRIVTKINDSISHSEDDSLRVHAIDYQENNEFTSIVRALNSVYATVNKNIENMQKSKDEVMELNKILDEKVAQRTQELNKKADTLENSLTQLKDAQRDLIESEKMASLGGLVAGVAHEINTPVGISVTAITHMKSKIREISSKFDDQTLTAEEFASFRKSANDGADIIESNLNKAADLIKSFKLVAVDQSSDERRIFDVKEYTDEVIRSLRPKTKAINPTLTLNIEDGEKINHCPGSFSQALTVMIVNSVIHGLDGVKDPAISISSHIDKDRDEVTLIYSDNGKGVKEEDLSKIFDPFYTTKRGEGGSGLGTHIMYNIINQVFKGSITAKSNPGNGLTYTIKFPTGF